MSATAGLMPALYRTLADGAWHSFTELFAQAAYCIPPGMASRACGSRPGHTPLLTGRAVVLRARLKRLGGTLEIEGHGWQARYRWTAPACRRCGARAVGFTAGDQRRRAYCSDACAYAARRAADNTYHARRRARRPAGG